MIAETNIANTLPGLPTPTPPEQPPRELTLDDIAEVVIEKYAEFMKWKKPPCAQDLHRHSRKGEIASSRAMTYVLGKKFLRLDFRQMGLFYGFERTTVYAMHKRTEYNIGRYPIDRKIYLAIHQRLRWLLATGVFFNPTETHEK